jgi:UDP-N-acetylmuramate dehydrogenase
MQILENISLKTHNTFHIEVKARYFVEVNSTEEIKEILNYSRFLHLPRLILGGGSNLLFVSDFDGIVIKMNLK